ncbi:uncharacterized protein LOC119658499 [Hermetia illucens]|uniref:uncharacterized protein LOC119658499 n=1 Tax=Hermetia illucens TaxID=343691 RepID=UPI0018CC59DA|nr:uncharacterized protein LOC119658499 [Hermetia illucens]
MAKAIRDAVFKGLLLFFIAAYICQAKRLYTFDVYRVSCDQANPKLVVNFSCSSRSLNRTLKAHTVQIALAPNMTFNDIYFLIKYNQRINNAYRRSIAEYEENLCKYLNGTAKAPLTKILWPYLRVSSNMPERCPFSGLINVTDLVFGDEYLPPFLPEGQAKLDVHIRNGKERVPILNIRYFIEVKPRGAAMLNL